MDLKFELYCNLLSKISVSNSLAIGNNDLRQTIEKTISEIYGKTNEHAEIPRITECRLEGSTLNFGLSTEGRNRAHEVLLRLRKQLASILGREYKVGIRDIFITRYEISFTLP